MEEGEEEVRKGRIETFGGKEQVWTVDVDTGDENWYFAPRYYFRVRAANGKIIAQSEGYNTKRARDNGIRALVAVCVAVGLGDR